jgi:hypothetical protein
MKKSITLGKKTYQFSFNDFDEEDVDIESLLKIDYSNLIGEMITFPIWVNRFGNMLAEAESSVSESKLNLNVHEAKLKEKYRLEIQNAGGKATVDAISAYVLADKSYIALFKAYINSQKTRDYISSIFWSAKDKSSKLDKLSLSIQPGDINPVSIEGRINNIVIKSRKNLIDD